MLPLDNLSHPYTQLNLIQNKKRNKVWVTGAFLFFRFFLSLNSAKTYITVVGPSHLRCQLNIDMTFWTTALNLWSGIFPLTIISLKKKHFPLQDFTIQASCQPAALISLWWLSRRLLPMFHLEHRDHILARRPHLVSPNTLQVKIQNKVLLLTPAPSYLFEVMSFQSNRKHAKSTNRLVLPRTF